jgi:hypothetical protein
MKKKIATIAAAVMISFGAAAQEQNLFEAHEINLNLFGTYVDQQEDHWGAGLGLQYFFSRGLGLGISTHWEDFSGSFFDNLNGEFYMRFPLGRIPVAPYVVGTGGYDWEENQWFGGGGVGAELRFAREIGAFGDVQWLVREEHDKDGVQVRVGIRLSL